MRFYMGIGCQPPALSFQALYVEKIGFCSKAPREAHIKMLCAASKNLSSHRLIVHSL